ncbi:MAG: SDR family NAD(P)-dependent oxidoreductase [Euryarchaeota archaeon]|nr:SDR family NAD(P)-dependent oxidoreductase [Euryarchaeota archaeon]
MRNRPLKGSVAVVAGATRGAGRGIAVSLGEAGATVYCTGRSTRGHPATPGRRETIEETAQLVTQAGGRGIAVRVDHTRPEMVRRLFGRVRREQHGRLDLLVNDVWGGDALTTWGKFPWELGISQGLLMLERGIHSHIITSRYALPLMVRRKKGLVVEITDGDHFRYRGNLFYDLVKVSVMRLAYGLSKEFEEAGLRKMTSVAVTPGFLRSETILEWMGVKEENWREGARKDPHFIASETPSYIGRAIAALAADPRVHRWSGRTLATWNLSREYGFTDVDGSRPDWGTYFRRKILKGSV